MTLLINPPPDNHRCEVCSEVADLRKTFRDSFPFSKDYTSVGTSWECEACLPYPDELIAMLREGDVSIQTVNSMTDSQIESMIREKIAKLKREEVQYGSSKEEGASPASTDGAA